jgi:hypothetical protein
LLGKTSNDVQQKEGKSTQYHEIDDDEAGYLKHVRHDHLTRTWLSPDAEAKLQETSNKTFGAQPPTAHEILRKLQRS